MRSASTQATRSIAALIVVLAIAGCGGDDEQVDPVPGDAPVVRDGELAGKLHLTPSEVEAGERVWVAIENLGEVPLQFGLRNRVEHFVDGRWQDVTTEIGPEVIPDVLLSVPPGERAGPARDGLRDRLELPAELEPGVYRASKEAPRQVNEPERGELTLTATFEVLPPQRAQDLWGQEFTSDVVIEDGEPRSLVSDTELQVRFTKRRSRESIGWWAGCNGDGTRLEIEGDQLQLGRIASTLMQCPEDLQEQDDWLWDFFDSDPEWRLVDEELTLTSGKREITLIASPGQTAPGPAIPR